MAPRSTGYRHVSAPTRATSCGATARRLRTGRRTSTRAGAATTSSTSRGTSSRAGMCWPRSCASTARRPRGGCRDRPSPVACLVVGSCSKTRLGDDWLVTDEEWQAQVLAGWSATATRSGVSGRGDELIDARALPDGWDRSERAGDWAPASALVANSLGEPGRPEPPSYPFGPVLVRSIGWPEPFDIPLAETSPGLYDGARSSRARWSSTRKARPARPSRYGPPSSSRKVPRNSAPGSRWTDRADHSRPSTRMACAWRGLPRAQASRCTR